MKTIEPEFRCPTKAAIKKLAAIFSLPNTPDMQDWEWQVADPGRIEEFLGKYRNGALTDDERFTLLEILLQSFEDSELDLNNDTRWKELLELIRNNYKLHEYTIWYWSVYECDNLDEQWRITPFMRELSAAQ